MNGQWTFSGDPLCFNHTVYLYSLAYLLTYILLIHTKMLQKLGIFFFSSLTLYAQTSAYAIFQVFPFITRQAFATTKNVHKHTWGYVTTVARPQNALHNLVNRCSANSTIQLAMSSKKTIEKLSCCLSVPRSIIKWNQRRKHELCR